MSVYVDPLFDWVDGSRWCHMIADTESELHAMALRLGLRRSWLHISSSGIQHYDLRPSKRGQAVKLGAIEITSKELVTKGIGEKTFQQAPEQGVFLPLLYISLLTVSILMIYTINS